MSNTVSVFRSKRIMNSQIWTSKNSGKRQAAEIIRQLGKKVHGFHQGHEQAVLNDMNNALPFPGRQKNS